MARTRCVCPTGTVNIVPVTVSHNPFPSKIHLCPSLFGVFVNSYLVAMCLQWEFGVT